MDITTLRNIDTSASYDKDSLLDVIARAHAGNTILFLGAGFSMGCTNRTDNDIPLAKQLSRDICRLGNFEEDDDLTFSADYYLKFSDASELIELLRQQFTVASVSKAQRNIAKVDWRRVYTTNYDNAYEMAASNEGKHINSLTLNDNPSRHFKDSNVCIHINGSINQLDEDSLEKSFKLTESSYTNSDAFSDSSWEYRFRKDIEVCNQIIFVGYSLYDMEVRRLLVNSEDVIRRTFFITRTDISRKEHHRLSSFGEVFPIGVDAFAEALDKNTPEELPVDINYLSAFKHEILTEDDTQYSDSDIRDFLLRGNSENKWIASSLTSTGYLYSIQREQAQEALRALEKHDTIVLHGSLANGKSVIIRQIISMLTIKGEAVFTIKDRDAKYELDIEKLASLNKTVYLVIDDFEDCIDVVRYFRSYLGTKGKLILAERPNRYRRAIEYMNSCKIKSSSINVDYLHTSELEQLEKLISNTGLWGELGGLSHEKKMRHLSSDCESQLSLVLMNILKSPAIRNRFVDSFSSILKHPDTKKAVHSMCLIQHIIPQKCQRSLIEYLSGSNHVYTQDFEHRVNDSDIFVFRGNEIATNSSVFATFVLGNLYNSSYSIDQIVRIADKLQKNRKTQSDDENEIYRSIMKFGTISSIMPDSDKPACYLEFYEKLKKNVPSVNGNPHFWLQYAMAVMTTDQLSDVEILLNTAYAKAENNPDYDNTYIDNQFARLNLKKAIASEDPKQMAEYFRKAHHILRKEESDVYKFRQAGLYIPFYQEKYSSLSIKEKVYFEHSIKEITKQLESYLSEEYPLGDIPPYQEEHLKGFIDIIEDIASNRKKG
ncbi:SIR2 family protein [Vibrio fluvialis]|nr:SIR2 family protein [Vibrio fluvialis]ELI5739771.1 SIR2 family protein [Vibrio fluvialis]